MAGALQAAQIVFLAGGQLGLLKQLCHAQHCADRGADIVSDARQHFAFRAVYLIDHGDALSILVLHTPALAAAGNQQCGVSESNDHSGQREQGIHVVDIENAKQVAELGQQINDQGEAFTQKVKQQEPAVADKVAIQARKQRRRGGEWHQNAQQNAAVMGVGDNTEGQRCDEQE